MQVLLCYCFFGVLHEAAHVIVAWILFVTRRNTSDCVWTFDSWERWVLPILISRCVDLSTFITGDSDQAQIQPDSMMDLALARHAGWITSLFLALILQRDGTSIPVLPTVLQSLRTAAWITAFEAICTDLLGLGYCNTKTTLLCGNFGVIMINPAWTAGPDFGKTALDLLETMVNVTMMRGAQSGGVVAWEKRVGRREEEEMVGVRSRVVNGKRTDLSKLLRSRVKKDCYPLGRIRYGIMSFIGHTRFATSSKATCEGTHPHQWCPPFSVRVYSDLSLQSSFPSTATKKVQNFITHNGDFDFFQVNGVLYDLHTIQDWLEVATGAMMPSQVDSVAIAGLIDIIRSAGSFGLSARFAFLLGMKTSTMAYDLTLPSLKQYETLGLEFELALLQICDSQKLSPANVGNEAALRNEFALLVVKNMKEIASTLAAPFKGMMEQDDEENTTLHEFVQVTIDAFFDNDLFQSTKFFLDNAKGSFGLVVTSALDAHRQICIAARGQPMSIALYPTKGIICYGSEQAAVKAGLNYDVDQDLGMGLDSSVKLRHDFESLRLDLDDLGGEICLIDWSVGSRYENLVSLPNRHLPRNPVLLGNACLVLHQQSKITNDVHLYSRMTLLENNEFIKPLRSEGDDPVLSDIQDIPRVCANIQADWQTVSMNRHTAWSLSRAIEERLDARLSGKIPVHAGTTDILLTGCEVSLWLAEQFAVDLQKAFPKLYVRAISSNKLLGTFGQGMTIPCSGYPVAEYYPDLSDSIVIIVSHSGGTFAPLACSNLLQSSTENIFAVTGDWDTQIGKQLRSMYDGSWLKSRVFTTEVGVRSAEACSVSVAATHQLLTLIFEHVCTTILSKSKYRGLTGAMITHSDLKVMERCNRELLVALEGTVGVSVSGVPLRMRDKRSEQELREAGRLWSDHILENARACVISFVYIIASVTVGYPIVTGFAELFGLETNWAFYVTRFLDALIYFFLPQINVLILRLLQGRNLRHRMVGRTAVIGDIPWVAQAADAFLSKLFACSYPIAGLTVMHGNPSDHLVHRHTHRIARGTLLICGRPDGRLSALTSKEATVCLTVNQASSIQSFGGTCESITIGHNPSVMSLTERDICLDSKRPRFLCEKLIEEDSGKDTSTSPHFLLGKFAGWANDSNGCEGHKASDSGQDDLIASIIRDRKENEKIRKIFDEVNTSKNGKLTMEEFVVAFHKVDDKIFVEDLEELFRQTNTEGSGTLSFTEFSRLVALPHFELLRKLDVVDRNTAGLVTIFPNKESFFGEASYKLNKMDEASLCKSQQLSMELYESRLASLHRFVAMTVMFHETASRVQSFFPRVSCGLLGYRIDRTHSIMRITTTASPVSGADVRERMERLKLMKKIKNAVRVIQAAWHRYRETETRRLLSLNVSSRSLNVSSRSLDISGRASRGLESIGKSSSSHTPSHKSDQFGRRRLSQMPTRYLGGRKQESTATLYYQRPSDSAFRRRRSSSGSSDGNFKFAAVASFWDGIFNKSAPMESVV